MLLLFKKQTNKKKGVSGKQPSVNNDKMQPNPKRADSSHFNSQVKFMKEESENCSCEMEGCESGGLKRCLLDFPKV